MSKLGAKTYTRRPDCKTSLQFDHLLAEKGNKPSTAKVSVAAVHRWGMTSFTSLRKAHLNGQKDLATDNVEPVKRLKKESSKPHVASSHQDPFNFETDINLPQAKSGEFGHQSGPNSLKNRVTSVKPKKFFKSSEGSRKEHTIQIDSSKKVNVEAVRLPVLQSCFTKLDDGLHTGIKKDTMKSSTCGFVDSEVKSVQSYLCFDTSPVITQDSPECVSVPVSLDSKEPVNYFQELNKEQNNIVLPSNENSRLTSSHSVDLDVTNNVISDVSRTSVKMSNDSSQVLDSQAVNPEEFEEKIDASCDMDVSSNVETNFESCTEEIHPICTQFPVTNNFIKDEHDNSSGIITSEKEQSMKVKHSSRSKKIFNSTKKPKAVYNHRHWQSFKEDGFSSQIDVTEEDAGKVSAPVTQGKGDPFDEIDEPENHEEALHHPKEKNYIGSKFRSEDGKQLYTVVRNVKQAYQVHESGEAQEFNDDIEYLLEGLQKVNGIGTRCLSVLGLATKCMGPAFRIHLRAHGTMPKIFSALQDAPSDPNLSLCAATLLFVLSQDRLTMDIDASTLCMMLQLLETDHEVGNPDKDVDLILEDPALCAMQEKHREKVYQLCEQMQQKGHAKHLKLDNINVSILAMEALLSLTSRKAGEWFKEEIRILHGLDRIVDTVANCVDSLVFEQSDIGGILNEAQLDKIRKVDRCLRVLENVTYMNSENQDYLLHYKDSLLSSCSLSLIRLFKSSLLKGQNDDANLSESLQSILMPILFCLLSVMKVLLNITFENSSACARIGSETGLMENVLMCIFQVPKAVPVDKRFDLLVLSLGLMINLVEHCFQNRKRFMETESLGSFDTSNDGHEITAAEGLVELLHSRLDAARLSEEQADELLNSTDVNTTAEKKDNEQASSQAECLEETLMKTLQKAGKHMEHSIIAAYISLLLGCVIQNNQEYSSKIKEYMPNGNFDVMVDVLKKFMSFVSLTGSVGSTGVKSIQRIIEVFSNDS